MMINVMLLPFFSRGAFNFGLSADKIELEAVKVDEFTHEPLEGEDAKAMAEAFCITLGLFIIEINIILHVNLKEENA